MQALPVTGRAQAAGAILGGSLLHLTVKAKLALQLAHLLVIFPTTTHIGHTSMTGADRAPASRGIEGEGGRLRLGKGFAALRAGQARADKLLLLPFQQADINQQ